MDRNAPQAGRLRSGRLAVLILAAVIVGACGSSAAGAGGGGGGITADVDKIIAASQTTIGTSMVGGELQGDTIVLTLVDQFGKGGANLFMCSNLKKIREKNDPDGTVKMLMVNESGEELAKSTDCK